MADTIKRYDIIQKIGRKYLTSNIENDEFSLLLLNISLINSLSSISSFLKKLFIEFIAKASASPYTKIKIVREATSSFDLDMQEKAFDVLKHLHIEII